MTTPYLATFPNRQPRTNRMGRMVLRFAFTGVWVALPLLPLVAILLTWLNGL